MKFCETEIDLSIANLTTNKAEVSAAVSLSNNRSVVVAYISMS